MKRIWRSIAVAVVLLVPVSVYGAGDIVLEGVTVTDAFSQDSDLHVRLTASAPTPVPPVCDVTLVNVSYVTTINFGAGLSARVLLKANCGTQLTNINWLRNGVSIRGQMNMLPNATGDVYFVTTPVFSVSVFTNVYTATGNTGTIHAGASAVIQTDGF